MFFETLVFAFETNSEITNQKKQFGTYSKDLKIGLVQVWSLHPEFGESFLNYLNSFISFLFPEIENNQQLPSAAIRAKNCIAQPARFKVIHIKY